jgi:hypothetical protein
MQKQLDFKHGCFAEAQKLLRATRDDRKEVLFKTRMLTRLDAVWRLKRRL